MSYQNTVKKNHNALPVKDLPGVSYIEVGLYTILFYTTTKKINVVQYRFMLNGSWVNHNPVRYQVKLENCLGSLNQENSDLITNAIESVEDKFKILEKIPLESIKRIKEKIDPKYKSFADDNNDLCQINKTLGFESFEIQLYNFPLKVVKHNSDELYKRQENEILLVDSRLKKYYKQYEYKGTQYRVKYKIRGTSNTDPVSNTDLISKLYTIRQEARNNILANDKNKFAFILHGDCIGEVYRYLETMNITVLKPGMNYLNIEKYVAWNLAKYRPFYSQYPNQLKIEFSPIKITDKNKLIKKYEKDIKVPILDAKNIVTIDNIRLMFPDIKSILPHVKQLIEWDKTQHSLKEDKEKYKEYYKGELIDYIKYLKNKGEFTSNLPKTLKDTIDALVCLRHEECTI